jgi:hypothetical protein
MTPAFDRPSKTLANMMRGARFVETLIVALALLLVGKTIGIAITLVAFVVALALAAVIVLGVHMVGRRIGPKN